MQVTAFVCYTTRRIHLEYMFAETIPLPNVQVVHGGQVDNDYTANEGGDPSSNVCPSTLIKGLLTDQRINRPVQHTKHVSIQPAS